MATQTQSFTLTVNPAPLVFETAPTLPVAVHGVHYSFTFTASGGVPPYKFNAVDALPAGLTLDPATGVLSGVPTVNGTFSFQVQVNDSQ